MSSSPTTGLGNQYFEGEIANPDEIGRMIAFIVSRLPIYTERAARRP